eukprot:1415656-Rhodomonas_salina.4
MSGADIHPLLSGSDDPGIAWEPHLLHQRRRDKYRRICTGGTTYTAKSNTRNHVPRTICTETAVS